ncbi:hypothetical protein FOZ62_026497 [Perkinsus olseni]|uniref:Uncharacterized protein n=1 Tax=Perkinsus olseni TaxID=32597 RepID=A0A7J6QMG5_PEROL|nr:hypothetical protein FOZ62_026497 [Perkinsus olseni]
MTSSSAYDVKKTSFCASSMNQPTECFSEVARTVASLPAIFRFHHKPYDSVFDETFTPKNFELEPPSRPAGWSMEEWQIAKETVALGITSTIIRVVDNPASSTSE